MEEESSVRLISVTHGMLEHKEPEEIITYCARVSNPLNQDKMDTAPRLLNYCIKHKHWSIFEMADMALEIKTSRAIAQQILRHRSFNFQEFSQRYAKVTEFITYGARRQDEKNRQSSIDDFDKETREWFKESQQKMQKDGHELYEEALKKGIAKECARFLLPLNTQTTLYMKGSVRSWIHYITVRCDESTQKEHRDIALKAKEIFVKEFPNTSEALEWKE
ncbi:MAG: FAD-dependent thymidylate synthase [Candidatus Micrarchaeota archaeon]